MSVSIEKHFKFAGTQEEIELKRAFNAALTDLTAAKAAIAGINAKLDSDIGINDTDYAATWDMGALELTE